MAKTNHSDKAAEQEKLTGTESFIDKYQKPLIFGLIGIVVVIGGIIGYQKLIAEPHEEESQDAYWNAFYDFQNGDTTGVVINGTDTYMGMEEVASDYSGTSGGNIASYVLAITAMEAGDFEGALTYLDDCEFEDVMIGTLVIGMKGDCNVELGNYEEAASFFEEAAAREENEFTSPMFLKKAGLTYEELGQNDKAVEMYQKISDEWPTTKEGLEIQKYLVRAQN
ncbi:MAG: tetratricopeptide repeat protein [Flavobacteriales bacterium]|nr:tetratricopeptide repeat protein [Flavobacteriales bacterium]